MQNEELQKAKAEIDEALEKYTDLYENAPAGYFTFGDDGTIQQMNLTGAHMVGIGRSQLIGRRFGLLVSTAHRPAFNSFLNRVFSARRKLSGNFELQSHGQWPLIVGIEAQRLPNGAGCRAVVVDISEQKRAEETRIRLEAANNSNSKLQREIVRRETVEAALRQSEGTARKLLEESNKMQRQLRDMSRRILQVQEDQRKEISRELHDQVTQTLVGINIHMAAYAEAVRADPGSMKRAAAPIRRLVERAVKTVHKFAQDLRPAMLDELGLITSLISYIKGLPKPNGLRIKFKAYARDVELDNVKRTVLYRVAQEALVNVAKHSRATKANVTIFREADGVCVEVADNGRSFDVSLLASEQWGKHLGLVGMRERVTMAGGTFSVESVKGVGTTVRAMVPLGEGMPDQ